MIGKAADELGDHPVFEDVVGGHAVEEVADLAVVLGLGLAPEADGLAADPSGDDVVEPDEGPAADEQDVGRVHLDVLLLGVLAAPLGRDVGHGPFEHLQERLLDPLAGDVAGDRDVVIRLADLVDLVDVDDPALGALQVEVGGVEELQEDVLDVLADVAGLGQGGGVADGEGDVQDPGQGPGQQGLAAAGRADQEDVRLVELDLGVVLLGVDEPLVVVVDGHREDLLGPVLVDHVGVELFLDLAGRGDVGEERLGDPPPAPLLVEDRLAELDAFAADVDVAGPLDERADVAIALPAERAIGVLLGVAGRPRGRPPRAAPAAPPPPASAAPAAGTSRPLMSLPDGMPVPFVRRETGEPGRFDGRIGSDWGGKAGSPATAFDAPSRHDRCEEGRFKSDREPSRHPSLARSATLDRHGPWGNHDDPARV